MTFAETHAHPTSAGHGATGTGGGAADPFAAAAAALGPELMARFHALIEEVADTLMKGKPSDRATCRADAVALLMASARQLRPPAEQGESPLMYLLQMEQHKAAAIAGGPAPGVAALTYLKA